MSLPSFDHMISPGLRRAYPLLIVVLVSFGPLIAIHTAPILGWGPWVIAGIELLFFLPVVITAIALLLTIILFSIKKFRHRAIQTLTIAITLAVLFLPMIWLSGKLRMSAFHLAANRAEPLVAALHRYSQENGAPPSTLEILIPKYLEAIPKKLPPLDLISGDPWRCGNSWILRADAGTGLLNWDEFLYYPNQNYESLECNLGAITKIGNWVYLHE